MSPRDSQSFVYGESSVGSHADAAPGVFSHPLKCDSVCVESLGKVDRTAMAGYL